MSNVALSFVTAPNERIEPLLRGEVQIEGVDLIPTYSDPSETFWRQLSFNEFEISEMSISSYLIAKANGSDMAYLPIFPSRRLFHIGHSFHTDAGIKAPGDLTGKRVGVGEYQQTSALWFRGVIENDFGVSQYSIEWWMERTEEMSHGGPTGFTPPPGINFQRIPPEKSLASMLVNFELDAAPIGRAFSKATNLVDRSTHIRAQDGDWSKVKPLFPNLLEEGKRFIQKHGFVAANHGYAIRADVNEKYPWLAPRFYAACVEAKALWAKNFYNSIPSGLVFVDHYYDMSRDIIGDDPYQYGVKANRPMLEEMIGLSFQQGLIKRKLTVDELFVPSLLDT